MNVRKGFRGFGELFRESRHRRPPKRRGGGRGRSGAMLDNGFRQGRGWMSGWMWGRKGTVQVSRAGGGAGTARVRMP